MTHLNILPIQLPESNIPNQEPETKKAAAHKEYFEEYLENLNRECKEQGLQFDEFGNPFIVDEEN